MRINQATIDLVKHFEGLGDGDRIAPGLQPYLCPAGYWTIGYGRVVRAPDGAMLKGPGRRAAANAIYPRGITAAQADAFLLQDLQQVGGEVASTVRVPLNPNQFGACVAFTYNVGITAFAGSTLLRLIHVRDWPMAADQFLRWNKATDPVTGQKLAVPGLTRRRIAERALFLMGV